MEGVIANRVTPLIKCVVLFLVIFTAKVLTSRPHESVDSKNSIHQQKPAHYVRTFTKYHHRRTIQWNNHDGSDWPSHSGQQDVGKRSTDESHSHWPFVQDLPKVMSKRSVSEEFGFGIENHNWPYSKDYINIQKRNADNPPSSQYVSVQVSNLNQLSEDFNHDNVIGSLEKGSVGISKGQNELPNKVKIYKMKTTTVAPVTVKIPAGPICRYKIQSVAMSVTPSYKDDKNAQLMVENVGFDTGAISEMEVQGETVEVQHCTDVEAACYTLWHQDKDGNVTVLGQGCWKGAGKCDICTGVIRLPATKFCCCTRSLCNIDYRSIKDAPAPAAEPARARGGAGAWRGGWAAGGWAAGGWPAGAAAAALLAAALLAAACRRGGGKREPAGSGDPDTMATGLSCVDNLTLIEHIGQGKFGSVWRGNLGSSPVAVKIYYNASSWHNEASIYSISHLAHPNLLKYYGSESRRSLSEAGRAHLVLLELCPITLRTRLRRAPLAWRDYTRLAHGVAAALAHLHTPVGNKPCIVHRDVNSSNVLLAADGTARLADLGLARAARDPRHVTEAGTLRYLAPEALEGALDLRGAGAALCAVDVFALALLLWELLWRTAPAHGGRAPPHQLPYAGDLPERHTLAHLQNLVCRNKVRPPLPKGPVADPKILKIACDTCEECWDHDAEARLTAVCVEERMAELKQMLQAQGPVIHDNNLHSHQPGADASAPREPEKNSNCTAPQCDITTPLLSPHMGRNACLERNTHVAQTPALTLIHKSLKDISVPEPPQPIEICLSMARTPTYTIPEHNMGSSYQRPLEYIPNDVTCHDEEKPRGPKETNLLQNVKIERPKWGIRKFFGKFGRSKVETEVKLVRETANGRTRTSIVDKPSNIGDRPSNLLLNGQYNFEAPCTLSPPNRTLSPTMMIESENRSEKVFGFRELPENEGQGQIFAVIVPKAKPLDFGLIDIPKRGSSDSINKSVRISTSSQSIFKSSQSGQSESDDSTLKKRLSDNRISNSGRSSRASINLELQYLDQNVSPFDVHSDCSSSEDEHLMLLSEGSKITMHTVPRAEPDRRKQNDILKESSQTKSDFGFKKNQNKYTNFDNEYSDQNDKENLVNGYSVDNPVYLAAINGEIDTTDLKYLHPETSDEKSPKSPKPSLKNLSIKRQQSLEQVSEIFSSSGDLHLQNPAGRVKTPGDLPVAIRRARRDRAMQKGRANECNRLSLYDDRMMFGNSL